MRRFLVHILLLGLIPTPLFAQEAPPSQDVNEGSTVQTEELPLESSDRFNTTVDLPADVSLDEQNRLSTTPLPTLKAQGFVFSDTATAATSTTAAIVAMTAGIPLHGIGHLWVEDTRTATTLFVAEGVALGLMGTAALLRYADDGASSWTGVAAPLFQLGFGTFVISYLLDVIGTLQGTELLLPRNIRNQVGLRAGVEYGFVTSAVTQSRHFIRAHAEIDADLVRAQLETTQNLLLGQAEYRGLLGVRLFRPRPQTFIHVDLGGEYFGFSELGQFDRITAEARLGGSLDLGTFFSQFDEVAVGTWIGAGRHFHRFGDDFNATTDFLAHRVYFHMNLTQRLNLTMGHGSHPSLLVPPVTRLMGVSDVEFRYLTEFGELGFRAELGDGLGMWLGGSVSF